MASPPSDPCPRCSARSCADRIAHEDSTEARIVMRCEACRHRWSAVVPIDESWPDLRQQLMRQSSFRGAT